MERKLLFSLILIFLLTPIFAQVKIGNNPSSIHLNSILELESSDKVLVISRMTDTQMNTIQPLQGALVFNTDQNCVFMYDGASWVSLCNGSGNTREAIKVTTSATPPSDNGIGDFWINDTLNNKTHIWDGSNWIAIDNNPRRGNGIPDTVTAPNPTSGDVYVDSTTGIIYAYNGTAWVTSNGTASANNGLLVNANNTFQLGGVLIQPTVIETDATNTLAISGLQNGGVTTDDIVTVDRTTGVLKRAPASNLLREEVTKIIADTNGQVTFTGLTLYTTDKINVFRNGVRIDFTLVNPTTITIEPDAACYVGDEIRIVQLY
ncbi:hypothetical protein [Tenacibaculum aestuarii]|uniref:hypothetical protein n=1 Tax=Tenacibaculum aestuarii TaxID=362781 RepID=UPI0038943598